jgi:hypothetical protein
MLMHRFTMLLAAVGLAAPPMQDQKVWSATNRTKGERMGNKAAGRSTLSVAQAKRDKAHRKGVRMHKQRIKSCR